MFAPIRPSRGRRNVNLCDGHHFVLTSSAVRFLVSSEGSYAWGAGSLTTQSIAVTMMQWTGPELHVQAVDWTLVKDEVGNLTGVNFFNAELAAKQFELLHEMLPEARRIAVVVDLAAEVNTEWTLRDLEMTARASGVQIKVIQVANSRDIDIAFEGIAREHLDGVFVSGSPFLNSRRVQLAQLAAHYSTPASYSGREFAEVGGLISYGSDITDAYRQVGIYCGHIGRKSCRTSGSAVFEARACD